MAALASGRSDERWIVATRRWTLAAWTCLGVAILLGAKWAYEEVGWGGYWAWDPVENAALMPWLVSTAFLHSVLIQERRAVLSQWTGSPVGAAVRLSIFRPLLTRRGGVRSVPFLTQAAVGRYFLRV